MLERASADSACVLAHVALASGRRAAASEQEEFAGLARSAGLRARMQLVLRRRTPHPSLYLGRGQAERVRQCCDEHGVQLLAINADLSPSQERNLEAALQCRVLGRTGLILDIFAQRARSHEGKLQVELAQLSYLSTRLVRGWSHLERQKGGIGLRGPGETQLELDRRLLVRRLRTLRRRLAAVERQRTQSRARRQRARLFHIALVGHTNAGKSTLFNRLTGSRTHVADQLFATLDPTHRRLRLGDAPEAVLSDTVGFIRDLPVELVQAFHATLEEVRECDLLLHVIDRSATQYAEQAAHVRDVLARIGASDIPVIEAYNKADRLAGDAGGLGANGAVQRLALSARTGAGVAELRAQLCRRIRGATARVSLCLPPAAYPLRAELYRLGTVEAERFTAQGECEIRLQLPRSCLTRFEKFQTAVRENAPELEAPA